MSTAPGLTALMRTPSWMWSRAAPRVRAETAALVAAYAAAPGTRVWAPKVEAMFTIEPPEGCERIWRISARSARNIPVRLMSSCSCQSADDSSAKGCPPRNTPALLTATSSEPKRSTAASTTAWISASRATSPVTMSDLPPASSISRIVSVSGSRPRPATTTCAPSAANARAMARPIPEPAPVTRAVLPMKRVMISPDS